MSKNIKNINEVSTVNTAEVVITDINKTQNSVYQKGNVGNGSLTNTTQTSLTFSIPLVETLGTIPREGANYFYLSHVEIDLLILYQGTTGLSYTTKLDFSIISANLPSIPPQLVGTINEYKNGAGTGTETYSVSFTSNNITLTVSNLSGDSKLARAYYIVHTITD